MTRTAAHEILVSPDGRLRVALLSMVRAEGGWSHSPRVIDQGSGEVLIDLWHSEWDAGVAWLADGRLELTLSRPGETGWCRLVLDPDTHTFELFEPPAV